MSISDIYTQTRNIKNKVENQAEKKQKDRKVAGF